MHTNRVLHGDARLLLPELAASGWEGSFRLAYADPPYNTGRSDRGPFPDHRPDAEWRALIGDVAARVLPLLTDDGSFWLHVNDRQLGEAQAACDAALGRDRFVGTIAWERTRRPSFLPGRPMANTTDFLLIYAKNLQQLRPFTDGTTEVGKRVPVAHRGNKLTTLDFPAGFVRFNCPDGLYPAGDHSSPAIRAQLLEDVVVHAGMNSTPLRLLLPSRYSQATVTGMLEAGSHFLIPAYHSGRPSFHRAENREWFPTSGHGAWTTAFPPTRTHRKNNSVQD